LLIFLANFEEICLLLQSLLKMPYNADIQIVMELKYLNFYKGNFLIIKKFSFAKKSNFDPYKGVVPPENKTNYPFHSGFLLTHSSVQ